MSITSNCVVNQVIWDFLTNCFTFPTKFWMLQVIKSDSCRISTIFFQCCFMIETQVLMTVSGFSGIFFRTHFLEWGFTFLYEGFFLRWGASFLSGGVPWGTLILIGGGGGFQKKSSDGGAPSHAPPPPLWETLFPEVIHCRYNPDNIYTYIYMHISCRTNLICFQIIY